MKNYTTISRIFNKTGVFIVLAFLLVIQARPGIAQGNDPYGLNDVKGLFKVQEHKTIRYERKSNKPENELEFLLGTGFNFYKSFISSQDNPSCVFYPSCSEYCVQAFQKKGIILGIFYSFDRLSRCHGLIKPGEYVFDQSKQRYYDPIR